mmetsp:Transcript_28551/g.72755  ORF Transcript_28551/g.72755 Transcript_28551/m.72755 type:complete len:90 (+) Transcript_28551:405-674(+)
MQLTQWCEHAQPGNWQTANPKLLQLSCTGVMAACLTSQREKYSQLQPPLPSLTARTPKILSSLGVERSMSTQKKETIEVKSERAGEQLA